MAQPKLLLCFSLIPAGKRSPAVSSAAWLLLTNLLERELFVDLPGHQKEWQEILGHPPKRTELKQGETVKAWIAAERE